MNNSVYKHPPPKVPPVRVTEIAIEPLLHCIARTIEFQLAIAQPDSPSGTSTSASSPTTALSSPSLQSIRPVIYQSSILGGVEYVACETINPSLAEALKKAVDAAKSFPIGSNAAAAQFRLRLRVSRTTTTKSFFMTKSQKLNVVEWEIKIVKTREEYTRMPSSSIPSSNNYNNNNTTTVPNSSSANLSNTASRFDFQTTPNNNSMASTGTLRDGSMTVVYSNDPQQVRELLKCLLTHCFASVDAEWYKDLLLGELTYEMDVLQ